MLYTEAGFSPMASFVHVEPMNQSPSGLTNLSREYVIHGYYCRNRLMKSMSFMGGSRSSIRCQPQCECLTYIVPNSLVGVLSRGSVGFADWL